MSATLADVARAARVHPGTVSKALNPATRHRVAPDTVRRIVRAAETLGYEPNSLARGLRTRRSRTIGVLIPDLANPLFPPIVRGIEQVLRAADHLALLTDTDNDPELEERMVAMLQGRRSDGFIVATARREHPLLDRLADTDTPLVLLNRITDNPRHSSVTGDDAAGVRDAVRHLVDLGHRRIAHLAGPQDLSTGHLRHRAFLDAVDQSGLDRRACPVVAGTVYSTEAGRSAARDLLALRPRPTAVLAGNDLMALGVLDALTEAGLNCPHDLSVIGFNDMPMLDRMATPLTTIRTPQHEIGAEAARLMLRILDGLPEPLHIRLTCRLIVRGSTAVAGGGTLGGKGA
ncbi:LacI family DNA-binding transcriptional regulator [Streptomyces sp. GESEQ-35]|uniref:LacI family DNA-binding transcriptional regulator n=1 Tax=Streptomyces sp. GESEQ-35 TaxID=2812657 RepID=UPI001B31E108|nr:LacI family DNA-binding transcriptional regulator [Streptomyces sp. GESEQ-35]